VLALRQAGNRGRSLDPGPRDPSRAWRRDDANERKGGPCVMQQAERGGDRPLLLSGCELFPPLSVRKSHSGDFVSSAFFADAEGRYLEAVARRDAIRDAWLAEGTPLLSRGSTAQLVEHPYVKMLRDHDLLVDRLGATARRRHSGPAPSAVVSASIGQSPAAQLRAV